MLWRSGNEAAGLSRWRYRHGQSRWWDWVEAASEAPIDTDERGLRAVVHNAGVDSDVDRSDRRRN